MIRIIGLWTKKLKKLYFKDKKSHYVDRSEWKIFENTQEPIIDQETFDNVQRIRGRVRRYPDGWGEAQPLTGILFCADCGNKLYVHRVNNGKREAYFTCGRYNIAGNRERGNGRYRTHISGGWHTKIISSYDN